MSQFARTLELSDLDGDNGFRLDGAGGFKGRSGSSAGGGDGDGYDDVIVGAFRANPNGHYSGASYVVFGNASGFDATVPLASLDGTDGFRLDGKSGFQSGTSVASAGDVNGDGIGDMIVGAP